MTPPFNPVLVLWDIDQTLIDIGGIGRRIYETAFFQVTGRPLGDQGGVAGWTERAILRDTLALHGMTVDDDGLSGYFEAIGQAAAALSADIRRSGRALPGAAAAVGALADAGAVQSVVTGNIKRVAIIKLEALDLARGLNFDIGGYGDESEDRASLVKQAMRRAGDDYGQDFAGDRVVVIGDTPHDIRAARDTGVRSVGVAAGHTSTAALAKAGATAVFDDLTDTAGVVAAVLMGSREHRP
ncbi:MAG: HAD hydrolase-like protein [Dactylosporangium sp.]|nr:haloacid dehalogenase-like hydrolase [Dactylosporangium sp.]NNJ61144.1 HAD hydrolase-like protein [Dactylosporangium sp.]